MSENYGLPPKDPALIEIKRLRAERDALRRTLNDHLESEAAESMRADKLRAERDDAIRHLADWSNRCGQTEAERDALAALLRELVALVRGECPSLLNEDSGGDAKLSCDIDEALKEKT